ncbi:MAG: hypothetical protein A2W27_04150 [Deltaproteobacteria bacterium RBG_16_44_11]|nr:MAG: hypothetical protein A2W27_04150 [Deltaproteobacteria bacterium RBG_16_44_11]
MLIFGVNQPVKSEVNYFMTRLTILNILVVLGCLFTGITFFRMYFRTRLKGYLLIFLGSTLALVGAVLDLIIPNADIFDQTLGIPGIILFVIGLIFISTFESGAVQNALSGHSIDNIMLGNISSLEKKKYPPTLKRNSGIIAGFLIIIYGIVECCFSNSPKSYSGIFIIVFGLAIFVFSIVTLKGNEKQ